MNEQKRKKSSYAIPADEIEMFEELKEKGLLPAEIKRISDMYKKGFLNLVDQYRSKVINTNRGE